MPDLTPEEKLANARIVEQYLRSELRRTQQAIRDLENTVVEAERRRKVAYRERRFTVEHTWEDDDPDVMHRGACRKNPTDGDLIQEGEAALMMRDRHIVACPTCNPLPALHAVTLARAEDDGI